MQKKSYEGSFAEIEGEEGSQGATPAVVKNKWAEETTEKIHSQQLDTAQQTSQI